MRHGDSDGGAQVARALDARAVADVASRGQWAYAAELLLFLALDRHISRNTIRHRMPPYGHVWSRMVTYGHVW